MSSLEPERFDLIGELAAGYPSVVIAEQTIEVYAKDLADIPLETLHSAIELCRRESRFFPTVPELRERAASITRAEAPRHPDSCICFGTGLVISEQGGYKESRRCKA